MPPHVRLKIFTERPAAETFRNAAPYWGTYGPFSWTSGDRMQRKIELG